MSTAREARSPLAEVLRGQLAGLVVGSAAGAVLGFVLGGYEPSTLASRLALTFVALLYGGFVGLLVGSVAGLVLRLLRGRPLVVAVVAVWCGVVLAATVLLWSVGFSATTGEAASAGVVLGLVAVTAVPWIRRTPRFIGAEAHWGRSRQRHRPLGKDSDDRA